jgi:hypothetical protein
MTLHAHSTHERISELTQRLLDVLERAPSASRSPSKRYSQPRLP